MLDRFYRIVRHGLKVRINYARNIRKLRQLRRQLNQERPKGKLVAIMLLEHLGDIVACEPVVRHLKGIYPDAHIVWGVKRAYRELIESNPLIDSTLIVHCLSERLMIENSGVFDEVVDLHFPDRHCSLCRKPLRRNKSFSDISLTNYFNYGSLLSAMCLSAGLRALDDTPKMHIPETAVRQIDMLNMPEQFIAVSCTSNAEEKNWPEDKWTELANLVTEKLGIPVVEVGLVPYIADTANQKYIDLCGKLSILESAEVIRRAKLFIGIDSGPAHIANAVGTPGVILIGSYLGFNKYNPFSGSYGKGDTVQIIYAEGLTSNIPIEAVLAAVNKMIGAACTMPSHAV
jgi:heptosyltransferase III